MSSNGRLEISQSLQTKIFLLQQKFRQVYMSNGEPLSYCNTIIKSINNNNFQTLQEEYKFKMYFFADEINSLKLGESFSQQLKKIIIERQEVIRSLRLELISNRASKQINLASVCEKLDNIRLLTLIILEKVEGCRKKLQVLQSPYFTEILHKLGQDIDFLRISSLRKFIQFSNNQDPLFMVPLRKFWSLGSVASSERRAIIDLFTINAQYKNRLEASDRFLRIMQKSEKRYDNSTDNQYSQMIDQLSSQFNSPIREQKMQTIQKFTLPSVNRNNQVFEQNNRSLKTKQMISSMIKQVVSQYKSKSRDLSVYQSPVIKNKIILSRSIDRSREVTERETLNEKFQNKGKNKVKYLIGRTANLRPFDGQRQDRCLIKKQNKLPQIDHPQRESSDSRFRQLDQYLSKQIDQSLYSSKLNSNPLRVEDIEIKNQHRKISGKIRYNQLSSLRGLGKMYTEPNILQNSPNIRLSRREDKLKTIIDEKESLISYKTGSKNLGSRFSQKQRNNSRSDTGNTPHLISQREYFTFNNQQKQKSQSTINRRQKQYEKREYQISPQFNYSLSKLYDRHDKQFIIHKAVSQQKLYKNNSQPGPNIVILQPQSEGQKKDRSNQSPYNFKLNIPSQNEQIYPNSFRDNQFHEQYPASSEENKKNNSRYYQINRIQEQMEAENATSHRTTDNVSKNQVAVQEDNSNSKIAKSKQFSSKQVSQINDKSKSEENNNLKETPIHISIKKSQNSQGKVSQSQTKSVNSNPKIKEEISKKNDNITKKIQNKEQLVKITDQQIGKIPQQYKINIDHNKNEQGNRINNTNKAESKFQQQKKENSLSSKIVKRQNQSYNHNKDINLKSISQENKPQPTINNSNQATPITKNDYNNQNMQSSKSLQKNKIESISNNKPNNSNTKIQLLNQSKHKNIIANPYSDINKQDKQPNKRINQQLPFDRIQNKSQSDLNNYQSASKKDIESHSNKIHEQKISLPASPSGNTQENKKFTHFSSKLDTPQKTDPKPVNVISKNAKEQNLVNSSLPKLQNNSNDNYKNIQRSQNKSSQLSQLQKTITTEKIGQMLKKCTFQSKMTKQNELQVIIKTLSLNLQHQILQYICQPYFTYRHILMTSCIFDNQYCGYCIYYPCIEPNQRTTYILHMQIVKEQFKLLETALFNTFVKYIFTNDPCERIIYLKNNRLINKKVVKELKNYESEVKTSLPLIKTQETSYLLERKDIKCSKDEEYTSVFSFVSLFISNKPDPTFVVRDKQTLLGQGYLKRFQQTIKKPQTKKFASITKLNEYLQSQELPEFKNIRYQSNIYLAKYLIQDCILSSKFFVLAKQFHFTIQYPYTCLYEGENAYFLAIASSVPDKYYIIADKLYEQSSVDLLQAMKDDLEGKSFDSLFNKPKFNGKVITCPSFGKHIHLPLSDGHAILEFGLFWKDYLKGLRYLQQEDLHLQVISPFLFGFVGLQSGRKIENFLSTIIDQKCLLK